MARYILKRVISAIITIWFIMTLTFIMMHSIPGNPFSSERAMDETVKRAIFANQQELYFHLHYILGFYLYCPH